MGPFGAPVPEAARDLDDLALAPEAGPGLPDSRAAAPLAAAATAAAAAALSALLAW